MATWHFDVHLLPRQKVLELFPILPTKLNRADSDIDWWDNVSTPNGILKRLEDILPRGESWSENLMVWGIEDSDYLELLMEGPQIREFSARIDVREISYTVLKSVINLANEFCLLILDENSHLYYPSVSNFLSGIKNSAAFRFVKDPHQFFSELERENNNGV